jgi:hypothetical protein
MKSAKKETRVDLIVIIHASKSGCPTATHALLLATPSLQPIKSLRFK